MEREIIIGIFTCVLGIFTYLIKSYFTTIKESIKQAEDKIAKIEGMLEPLRKDIKDVLIAITVSQSELKAVWRYIDKPKRVTDASDIN